MTRQLCQERSVALRIDDRLPVRHSSLRWAVVRCPLPPAYRWGRAGGSPSPEVAGSPWPPNWQWRVRLLELASTMTLCRDRTGLWLRHYRNRTIRLAPIRATVHLYSGPHFILRISIVGEAPLVARNWLHPIASGAERRPAATVTRVVAIGPTAPQRLGIKRALSGFQLKRQAMQRHSSRKRKSWTPQVATPNRCSLLRVRSLASRIWLSLTRNPSWPAEPNRRGCASPYSRT